MNLHAKLAPFDGRARQAEEDARMGRVMARKKSLMSRSDSRNMCTGIMSEWVSDDSTLHPSCHHLLDYLSDSLPLLCLSGNA